MGTKNGIVKKTKLEEFKNLRKNGLNAITLRDGDELLKVKMTKGDADIIVVTQNGMAVKFNETDVRPMGRTASGVKAITLKEDDIAVCMDIATPDEELLVVSENGYGKRTPTSEYKVQNRGGKGLITYKITEKTGKVIGATVCKSDDELMLINSNGIAIRINVSDISITGRSAMGVKLMRTLEEEQVVTIAKITGNEEADEKEEQISLESSEISINEEDGDSSNNASLNELLNRAMDEDTEK